MGKVKGNISTFELLLVLTVVSLVLFASAVSNPLHSDESNWIASSIFFEQFFLFQTDKSAWQENYWTLSEPNLPRYLIAIGHYLAGIDRNQLNKPYDVNLSFEENQAQDRVPSTQMLYASRVPMVTLAVAALGLFYIILRTETGPGLPILFLLLILINNIIPLILLRAMSEAPLLFLFLLCIIFTIGAQKYWVRYLADPTQNSAYRKAIWRIIACSFCVGLAAACKINAFGVGISFFFLLLYWVFGMKSSLSFRQKTQLFLRIFVGFTLLAIVVFILVTPYLYQNPIYRIGQLLKFRIEEIAYQVSFLPELVTMPIFQRGIFILKKLLNQYSSLPGLFGFWFNLSMLIVGCVFSFHAILRAVLRKLPIANTGMILILAFFIVAAALMSPLDWSRYFFFPELIFLLLITTGVFCGIRNIFALMRRHPQDPTQ